MVLAFCPSFLESLPSTMDPSGSDSPLHSISGGSQLDLVEQLAFLDVSLEDDSLLPVASKDEAKTVSKESLDASSVVEPENTGLGEELVTSVEKNHMENQQEADFESLADQSLDMLGPLLTEEPLFRNKTKKNGFNLRKSLAWNNAFLTGEGVLDSEELSLVNKTFRKNLPPHSKVSCYRQPSKAPKMPNIVMIPKMNPTSIPPNRSNTNIDSLSIPRVQAGGSPRSSVESITSTESKRSEGNPSISNGSTGVRRLARKPAAMSSVQSDLPKQEKQVAEVSEEDHSQKRKKFNTNNGSITSVHSQLPAKSSSGRMRSQAVSITAIKVTSGVVTTSTQGEKPSGLRMPSPKLGFFDTSRISSQVAAGTSENNINRIVATNKLVVDGNNGKRHTGLRRPGAAHPRSKQVIEASGLINRVAANDSSSSIPSAPHKRTADIEAPAYTKSTPPFSFANRKMDDDLAQVLQAKNTVKNVSVRGKLTATRSTVEGSGQENSHPDCKEKQRLE